MREAGPPWGRGIAGGRHGDPPGAALRPRLRGRDGRVSGGLRSPHRPTRAAALGERACSTLAGREGPRAARPGQPRSPTSLGQAWQTFRDAGSSARLDGDRRLTVPGFRGLRCSQSLRAREGVECEERSRCDGRGSTLAACLWVGLCGRSGFLSLSLAWLNTAGPCGVRLRAWSRAQRGFRLEQLVTLSRTSLPNVRIDIRKVGLGIRRSAT